MKKLFLKFRNIHRKSPSGLQLYQKRLQRKCFPVITANFLKTSILKNICEWLLLKFIDSAYGLIHLSIFLFPRFFVFFVFVSDGQTNENLYN